MRAPRLTGWRRRAHAAAAVKAGATPAQPREAAGVAVMTGGGPVYTHSPRVEEALAALADGAD